MVRLEPRDVTIPRVPVALVHGNPETTAVWDPLVAALDALGHPEPLRLSPPGFGAPVPAGFGATIDDYRHWLIGELDAVGEPVDIVGHDWGGGHVLGVAMTRPDLVRSWTTDMIGVFAPGYEWHADARIWQTPGEGEAWVAEQLAVSPERRARFFVANGVEDERAARAVADGFDAAMGACILALYRSARQPVPARLGASLGEAAARPGLAIVAAEDRYVGTAEQHRAAAGLAEARVTELPGLGHWWPAQRGGRAGARALVEFWASLE